MTSTNKAFPGFCNRRAFLQRASIAAATFAAGASLDGTIARAAMYSSEYVVASTSYGPVRGLRQSDLSTFKGVPYAGSVSGANRFRAALPLKPWTGVRDALRLGAPSWQPDKTYFGINEPAPEEDCLFLNIWTPAADGRKRPVMFYNHGGGFIKGSGGAVYQDGGNLARTYDVVVVETNHRLGLLGYLFLGELGGEEYAASGNQGLLDIKDALQWVHGNIEAFGGDKNNVMIFGESGGGLKTSALYAMPSAQAFFHKASIESGPGITMMPRDQAAKVTRLTLTALGLDKSQWRQLSKVPVEKLVAAQGIVAQQVATPFDLNALRKGSGWMLNGGFAPVVDGTVLPHDPFDPAAPAISKSKPLMVGTNRDETAFVWFQAKMNDVFTMTEAGLKSRLQQSFGTNAELVFATYRQSRPEASWPDLYTAITTACMMTVPATTIGERKFAQAGAPVYMYLFNHPSNFIIPGTNHPLGAAHALEIPYKFDNIHPVGQESHADVQQPGSNYSMDSIVGTDPDRQTVASHMSQMWSEFAKTSHPSAKGQPSWPPYTTKTRATMRIDTTCEVVNDPFGQERRMWEQLDTSSTIRS